MLRIDKTIAELQDIGSLDPSDVLLIYDISQGKTRKVTVSDLNIVLESSELTVSDTPPISPQPNKDLWFDSINLRLKVYYFDGSNSQWVDAFPQSESTGFYQLQTPEGLIISRSSITPNTHLEISPGRCVLDGPDSRYNLTNPTTWSKRIDQVWSAGAGNGGRFSGTLSANQTWHVFVMRSNTSGAIDFGFSTSVIGSDKPSGWSVRRIGSWLLDGSSNLRNIKQLGSYFRYDSLIQDVYSNVSAGAALYTTALPSGLKLVGHLNASISNATLSVSLMATDPDDSDVLMTSALPNMLVSPQGAAASGSFSCSTNTSSQVRIRLSVSGNLWLRTIGWTDERRD